MNMIIARYDEIGLKSKFVRREFENILVQNINRVLSREKFGKNKVSREPGRIYIYSNDRKVAERVSKIFGIASTAVSEKKKLDLEENAEYIAELWRNKLGSDKSFAVRVKRKGKHDFTSMDAAKIIGKSVREVTGARVDLKNPDKEIIIEIRDDSIYIITETFKGYGGLPTGTQERVLCLFCDEKSFLSTWYALKRGCDIDVIYNPELKNYVEKIPYWAAYRKINFVESGLNLENMLLESFNMELKGIYCSLTLEEIETYIEILRERRMPVFTPLISFDKTEIERKIENLLRIK